MSAREIRDLRGSLRALGRHTTTVLYEDDLDRIEERVLAWHQRIVAARVGEAMRRGIRWAVYEAGDWCGDCDPTDSGDGCCVLPPRFRDALARAEATP